MKSNGIEDNRSLKPLDSTALHKSYSYFPMVLFVVSLHFRYCNKGYSKKRAMNEIVSGGMDGLRWIHPCDLDFSKLPG